MHEPGHAFDSASGAESQLPVYLLLHRHQLYDLSEALILPQVELARWLGAPMLRASLFDKMRDAIKDDIEKLLANAPEGRPQAQRFTRKEQVRQLQAVASADDAEGGGAASPAAAAAAAAAVPDSEVCHDVLPTSGVLSNMEACHCADCSSP
jgi:hypothetical protein